MRISLIMACLTLCLCSAAWGQAPAANSAESPAWGLRLGAIYGGPIPTNSSPDSTAGSPGLGPALGLTLRYPLSSRFSLRLELGYAYKAVEYARIIRQDTLVPLELLPGVTDTVPSFYIADVNGSMKFHYLEMPMLLEYRPTQRVSIEGGLNLGLLLAGEDVGTAEIQIGEGGVFEDTTQVYDNIDDIRRIDLALAIGGAYEFPSGWWFGLRGTRSLGDLYRKGFLASQGLRDTKLFHTHVLIGGGYWF